MVSVTGMPPVPQTGPAGDIFILGLGVLMQARVKLRDPVVMAARFDVSTLPL